MKIKLSYASAVKLGLKKGKLDFPLKTIYLMVGERCQNACKFCSQSSASSISYSNYLSRVIWQDVDLSEFLGAVHKNTDIKRICLQVVAEKNFEDELPMLVEKLLLSKVTYKMSISLASTNLELLEHLFSVGADIITIPLDCAKLSTYEGIKGSDFKERLKILCTLSKNHKNHVGTHLIYGLSDTEKDFYEMMRFLKSIFVNTGLFSFTPLPGTKLEKFPSPSLSSYRKIQVLRALIYKDISFKPEFDEYGNLLKLHVNDRENFEKLLKSGVPFLTSGCDNCTRPYYNDSPSRELYNFHRPLIKEEIKNCLEKLIPFT